MYVRRHKTIQEDYQEDYHRRTLMKQEERKGPPINQIWTSNVLAKTKKILELELNSCQLLCTTMHARRSMLYGVLMFVCH